MSACMYVARAGGGMRALCGQQDPVYLAQHPRDVSCRECLRLLPRIQIEPPFCGDCDFNHNGDCETKESSKVTGALAWADSAAKTPEHYDDCLGRALITLAAEVRRLLEVLKNEVKCHVEKIDALKLAQFEAQELKAWNSAQARTIEAHAIAHDSELARAEKATTELSILHFTLSAEKAVAEAALERRDAHASMRKCIGIGAPDYPNKADRLHKSEGAFFKAVENLAAMREREAKP